MKIYEIEEILREKTTLRETWINTKACGIFLGKYKLNDIIQEFCKEDTKMSKQQVWVDRDWYYYLGMSEVTVTRKVTDIVVNKANSTYTGIAKIAGKRVKVSKIIHHDEWSVDLILKD